MDINKKKLNNLEWENLIRTYNAFVTKGKYKHFFSKLPHFKSEMIDYQNIDEVHIIDDVTFARVSIHEKDRSMVTISNTYYYFDNSFGEFIHNYLKGRNYFVEEDDSNMIKEYLNSKSVNFNDEYTNVTEYTNITDYTNVTDCTDILGKGTSYWDYEKATTAGVAAIAKTAVTTSDCLASDWGTVAIKANTDTLSERINLLENRIAEKLNKKENEKMDMKKLGFDFGPCGSSVKLSMYGLAIKNAVGEWVSYNKDTKEIVNVDILNFDAKGLIYKMPVAAKEVGVGDVIIHNGVVMFIEGINKDEETKKMQSVIAVDPKMGEVKEIILTKNMFGFNFITKVVNLFEMIAEKPSEDNPFGNMLPLMMFGEEHGDLAVMAMMMNSKDGKELMSNPMMFMALKDKKDLDPMMLMMLMNMNK